MIEIQVSATPILYDNKSAFGMSKNHVYHRITKHIALKFHYIRDAIEKKEEVDVVYCNTEDQVADIFTKAIPKDRFIYP